ncbi:Bacterial alpha-L-rhamnosidase [Candidatus Poribacteria bacterium]|nr:Bacterial alpha-L-rhamnosidase [Candidatus Poribacteria bacterium]
MNSKSLSLPRWIWHPQRKNRLKTILYRRFELHRNLKSPKFGIALTGSTKVMIDGITIMDIPESPANICKFNYMNVMPLGAGEHLLEIQINCKEPVPEHPAISFAHDRTVGCAAWLEGKDFRLVTDDTWSADDDLAEEICLLGQEPFGNPDYPPDDFVRSGFGDLKAYIIQGAVMRTREIECQRKGSLIKLSGKIKSGYIPESLEHESFIPIYHLRKQDDWKRLRKIQWENQKEQTPSVLFDLQREYNARLCIHNLSAKKITILWNGAESLLEMTQYDNCITEILEVNPGETVYSVPTGMKYVGLFVMGAVETEFDLDLVFESVGAKLSKTGNFQCDDEQINKIYETAVHTNYLCHQLALWDGIKRDRLPWVYDLYLAARGAYPIWNDFSILRRSLVELGETPYGLWMNGTASYTLWWFVTIWEYLMQRGDFEFVYELKPLMQRHIKWVTENIDENGFLNAPNSFIDWVPIKEDERHLSLQAIYTIARQALFNIKEFIPDLDINFNWSRPEISGESFLKVDPVVTKVLGILAGYVDNKKAFEFADSYRLADPITPCSAYLLACLDVDLDIPHRGFSIIRSLWGGMLARGATTFWEAARCKYSSDFHKDLTTYTAYDEYRISLCHAWSSTPVEWFSRVLLGVNPVTPGYSEVEIAIWTPDGINRCEGTVSTPRGPIGVSWIRKKDGQIVVKTEVPEGVRVV